MYLYTNNCSFGFNTSCVNFTSLRKDSDNITAWGLNLSTDTDDSAQFFNHYYAKERFIMECFLAGFAFLINTISFGTSHLKEHQHYAYYALFRNLTLANSMFCLTLWLSNNILFLIHYVNLNMTVNLLCHIMAYMSLALIANTSIGLVSTATLMGFSLVHYIAVCHPLIYPLKVNKCRINMGLATTWITISTLALVPIIIILIKVIGFQDCDITETGDLSRFCMNVSVPILQLMVILIIGFCIRIHLEIRKLQSRLSQYSWVDEMELERKTFRSILLLVCTMILLYVPFNVMYVISLNTKNDDMVNNKFVVYYMTLSLYLKFILDPIFYRKTFMDIQASVKACIAMFACCFSCKCKRCRRRSYHHARVPFSAHNRNYKHKVITVL